MIAALLLFSASASLAPAASAPPSARPREGSGRSQTSVGRDLDVAEPVSGNVVGVLSSVRIAARVSGNVIVWGGDVVFAPGGSVDGNLSVFGGEIVGGRRPIPVAGAVSTPGSLLRLYLDEMHRPPWEEASRLAAMRGLRIVALSVWLLGSLLLLYLFGSPFARAAAAAEGDWTRALLAGAFGVLTLFLAASASLALLPAALSIPIAIAVGAFAVVAKIFGMGALFLIVGQKLLQNVEPRRRPMALAAGFALVGGVSLIPLVGALVWSIASVVAVGVALASRFGTPRFSVSVP
jgi:hypothetical protein